MQVLVSNSTSRTTQYTQSGSWRHRFQQSVHALGDRLCRTLTSSQDAVQVHKRECHGVTTWFVYNHITEERQQFTAEADVHHWLEQRYRQ